MAARVGKYLLFETLGEGAFGKYVFSRVPMPVCQWVGCVVEGDGLARAAVAMWVDVHCGPCPVACGAGCLTDACYCFVWGVVRAAVGWRAWAGVGRSGW